MVECPVCGEPAEYRETREGGGATLEVDELCEVEAETRWNRICPRAVGGEGGAALEVYRHNWEATSRDPE